MRGYSRLWRGAETETEKKSLLRRQGIPATPVLLGSANAGFARTSTVTGGEKIAATVAIYTAENPTDSLQIFPQPTKRVIADLYAGGGEKKPLSSVELEREGGMVRLSRADDRCEESKLPKWYRDFATPSLRRAMEAALLFAIGENIFAGRDELSANALLLTSINPIDELRIRTGAFTLDHASALATL